MKGYLGLIKMPTKDKKVKKTVIVKDQDINMLRFVFESKVVQREDIQQFYESISSEGLRKRLFRLIKRGYLKSQYKPEISSTLLYSITKKGFDSYLRDGSESSIQLSSDSIKHDLNLLKIAQRFKKSERFIEFLSENRMQTWGKSKLSDQNINFFIDNNSDGLVRLKNKKEEIFNFSVEYEQTFKTPDRYKSLFQVHYNSDSVDGVLYIFKNFKDMERVKKIESENFNAYAPKFLYQTLDSFLQDSQDNFVDRNESSVSVLNFK